MLSTIPLIVLSLISSSIPTGSCAWPVGLAGSQNLSRTIMTNFGGFHGDWHSCTGAYPNSFHPGIDILPYDNNFQVRAASSGTIIKIIGPVPSPSPYVGQFVMVIGESAQSQDGWTYQHITDPAQTVTPDNNGWQQYETVAAGDLLGEIYPTSPTICHLHFGWGGKKYESKYGSDVDPLDFITPSPDWVWNRQNDMDFIMFIKDLPISSWPGGTSLIFILRNWQHVLRSNSLRGEVDILYGYCLEAIGDIGNPFEIIPINPKSVKWELYSHDLSTKFFTKNVVDFSGLLGVTEAYGTHYPDIDKFQSYYFSLPYFQFAAMLPRGLITCISNCKFGSFPDPGIDNIQEDCWNTAMSSNGQGTAFVPTDALTPDGSYLIKVTSQTHEGAPHIYETECKLDNYVPYVKSVEVSNDEGVFYNAQYVTPSGAIPHSDERELQSSFSPRDGATHIQVAIEFSEPVEIDEILLYAEVGDETVWTDDLEYIPSAEFDLEGLSDSENVYVFMTENLVTAHYLGRLVLSVDAHDLSPNQNKLDADPTTIPYPTAQKLGGRDDFWEEGSTVFEWNVAWSFTKYTFETTLVDAWMFGTIATGLFGHMYTLDLDDLFGQSPWNNHMSWALSSSGPLDDIDDIPKIGGCEHYAGFWPFGYYRDPDKYNKVYLLHPDPTGNPWFSYVQWQLPLDYSPEPSVLMRRTSSEQNQGIAEPLRIDEHRDNYPISWISGSVVNYSTGNYCFVAWNDAHDEENIDGHITCISSLSLETITLHYNDIVSVSAASGEMVKVRIGPPSSATYEFYEPYDPQFFYWENPERIQCRIDEPLLYNSENESNSLSLQTTFDSISPNPASCSATLSFILTSTSPLTLDVYDLRGRMVASLINQTMETGNHDFIWDLSKSNGQAVPSGIYYVRMSTPDCSIVKPLIVIR